MNWLHGCRCSQFTLQLIHLVYKLCCRKGLSMNPIKHLSPKGGGGGEGGRGSFNHADHCQQTKDQLINCCLITCGVWSRGAVKQNAGASVILCTRTEGSYTLQWGCTSDPFTKEFRKNNIILTQPGLRGDNAIIWIHTQVTIRLIMCTLYIVSLDTMYDNRLWLSISRLEFSTMMFCDQQYPQVPWIRIRYALHILVASKNVRTAALCTTLSAAMLGVVLKKLVVQSHQGQGHSLIVN